MYIQVISAVAPDFAAEETIVGFHHPSEPVDPVLLLLLRVHRENVGLPSLYCEREGKRLVGLDNNNT
jgi:hypothetical protein